MTVYVCPIGTWAEKCQVFWCLSLNTLVIKRSVQDYDGTLLALISRAKPYGKVVNWPHPNPSPIVFLKFECKLYSIFNTRVIAAPISEVCLFLECIAALTNDGVIEFMQICEFCSKRINRNAYNSYTVGY